MEFGRFFMAKTSLCKISAKSSNSSVWVFLFLIKLSQIYTSKFRNIKICINCWLVLQYIFMKRMLYLKVSSSMQCYSSIFHCNQGKLNGLRLYKIYFVTLDSTVPTKTFVFQFVNGKIKTIALKLISNEKKNRNRIGLPVLLDPSFSVGQDKMYFATEIVTCTRNVIC